MTLSGRPSCSCDGTNANCSRCFGTGVVPVRDVGRSFVRSRKIRSNGSSEYWSRRQKCPRCQIHLLPEEIPLHLALRHSIRRPTDSKPQRSIRPRPPSPGRRLVPCGVCSSNVREDRLARHRREVHRIGSPSSTGAVLPPRGRPERAARGTDRVVERGGARAEPSRKIGKHVTGQPSSPDVEYRTERSLDSSRDFYRFRETGRFGSHSMHDDFGDESNS